MKDNANLVVIIVHPAKMPIPVFNVLTTNLSHKENVLNLAPNLHSSQMVNANNVTKHVDHVKMLLTNVQLVLKDTSLTMKNVFPNVLQHHSNLIILVLLVQQIVRDVKMLMYALYARLNISCKEPNANLNVMMDTTILMEHVPNVQRAVLLVLELMHARHAKMDLNLMKVIAHLDVLMDIIWLTLNVLVVINNVQHVTPLLHAQLVLLATS